MNSMKYGRVGFTLFALFFASVLAFLDRQLLNILVDPIRSDVDITDVQFSLLQGAAFALVYCAAAFPIAYLADRSNRKLVLLFSVGAWSMMTLLFGLSDSFGMLLVARMGVALGEAGLSPAAISIIRQIYPGSRQSSAIALLTISVYVGGSISMILGGPALALLANHAEGLPFSLPPWRFLFVGCASLGLIGMIFLMAVPEPVRIAQDKARISLDAFFGSVKHQKGRVVAYLMAGVGLNALVFSVMSWTPAMFMRTHGWGESRVGLTYGIVYILGGVIGALTSGKIVNKLSARGQTNAIVTVLRGASILLGCSTAAAVLMPNGTMALVCVGSGMVGIGALATLGAYGFQTLFPEIFSARAVALNFLVSGTLGASLGPSAVPMIAQLFGGEQYLGQGLALFACLAVIWGVIFLTIFLRVPAATTNGAELSA